MTKETIHIFVDGGSRGNPGEAGIGVVIKQGKKILNELGEYIGKTTNNVAEYVALNRGLQEALAWGHKQIEVFSDSELLVNQIKGEYKVREETLRPLHYLAVMLLKKFEKATITHIPREKNKEADKLVNKVINEHSYPLFA